MERSLYALIGSTLFGFATFGVASLGFLWSNPVLARLPQRQKSTGGC
jgi:hypothetical protein